MLQYILLCIGSPSSFYFVQTHTHNHKHKHKTLIYRFYIFISCFLQTKNPRLMALTLSRHIMTCRIVKYDNLLYTNYKITNICLNIKIWQSKRHQNKQQQAQIQFARNSLSDFEVSMCSNIINTHTHLNNLIERKVTPSTWIRTRHPPTPQRDCAYMAHALSVRPQGTRPNSYQGRNQLSHSRKLQSGGARFESVSRAYFFYLNLFIIKMYHYSTAIIC